MLHDLPPEPWATLIVALAVIAGAFCWQPVIRAVLRLERDARGKGPRDEE